MGQLPDCQILLGQPGGTAFGYAAATSRSPVGRINAGETCVPN
jgi:hypothetical protein